MANLLSNNFIATGNVLLGNVTREFGTIADPDGGTDAIRFIWGTGTATNDGFRIGSGSLSTNTDYVFTCKVRRNSGTDTNAEFRFDTDVGAAFYTEVFNVTGTGVGAWGAGNEVVIQFNSGASTSFTSNSRIREVSDNTELDFYEFGLYTQAEYDTLTSDFVSGTITLSGVAQANAVVDIISCPTVSEGTKTIVEQVTADANGEYTATIARNTALNYWAEPRHYVEEFTGTLTPVSGTTFSTGVDLSGVSIGGADDPLYVLKSTANPSGEEVVVESRSGNDITLSYDPGFDETTTFSLGKAYGANTVLARSTVS